jgi:hypothetical protein
MRTHYISFPVLVPRLFVSYNCCHRLAYPDTYHFADCLDGYALSDLNSLPYVRRHALIPRIRWMFKAETQLDLAYSMLQPGTFQKRARSYGHRYSRILVSDIGCDYSASSTRPAVLASKLDGLGSSRSLVGIILSAGASQYPLQRIFRALRWQSLRSRSLSLHISRTLSLRLESPYCLFLLVISHAGHGTNGPPKYSGSRN